MTRERTVAGIKRLTFEIFTQSPHVWIIEERGAEFIVHTWTGEGHVNGSGVHPPSSYPTLRKAAARFLQMLGVGAVAPQTWPEDVCVDTVITEKSAPVLLPAQNSAEGDPPVMSDWDGADTDILLRPGETMDEWHHRIGAPPLTNGVR